MKKISTFIIGFLMVASLAIGIKAVAEENFEKSAVAFTLTVASMVAMPSGKQTGALGFMNKSYFQQGDDPYTRAEFGLLGWLAANGKEQTIKDIKGGNLKLETYARVFRFVVPAAFSGRRELLNAGSSFIQGAIPEEFNLAQLPLGYNIAVTHVRTGFVADAVITTGQAGVAYASQPNGWPAALRNGQYIFSQAGAVKAFVDVAYTGTMTASFGSFVEDDGLELQAPFILEENKSTKFELYGAAAQSFASPAGGNLLELALYGAMVRLRS